MAQGPDTRYTILLVDDNPDLLKALTITLSALGNFNVATATDGGEGLEQFYSVRPDCMVIDIRMPGVDGYQLVRALRGDPETWDTPMVILTALAQDRDQFAGFAAGADAYLVKPVKPQDLAAAIRHAIATTAQQREQRMRDLVDKAPPDD
jgi:two-component system, OmpR family, alkaline phosphatase synthesis response regulator PhoP